LATTSDRKTPVSSSSRQAPEIVVPQEQKPLVHIFKKTPAGEYENFRASVAVSKANRDSYGGVMAGPAQNQRIEMEHFLGQLNGEDNAGDGLIFACKWPARRATQ
jgi:hypothetical protein